MSSLKKLFIQFSHFVGGSALSMLLGLITFPILTRLLTREDYGILGLVSTTISIAVAFAKAGLSDGIIRFYPEYADTVQRRSLFTSTVLVRGATLALITVVAYVLILPRISRYLDIDPKYLGCFMVMALYLFVRPLNIIVLNYLRALGKTFFYNAINFSTKVVAILSALALLLYVIKDLYGYFLGTAIAEVASTVVLYRWLLSNYQFTFRGVSAELTANLLKFGLPLLLTETSYLLLSYVDRYMIIGYQGEAILGLYTVGYNLPSYLNDLIMFSLSYAVVPLYTEMYMKEGKEKTEAFLGRVLNYYFMAVIPLCAGYYAVARDLLVALASDKYAEAAAFSPVILIGLVFLGMNAILNAGLYLQKQSMKILSVMIVALVVNIALNTILLPPYGAAGAAWARLIACVASSVLAGFLSFRYLSLRINLRTPLYYLAASGVMLLVIVPLDTANEWLNLCIKIPLGAAVIAAATWLREKEVRELVQKRIQKNRPL
jgi:O-antigen/teichoic acid export membrane protein